MKTTILICTPDSRSRIFRKCLDSVKKYTNDYELIIFDNDHDQAFNHAKEINRAMSMAKGDYFVAIDDDVEVEKNWLSRLTKAAEKEKAGIVGCIHKYEDGTINHAGGYVLLDGRAAHYVEHLKKDMSFPYVCSAVMLIDLRLCKKIKFDERFRKYYQDTDFCLFAWEKGIKVISASGCRVIHHVGKTAGKRTDLQEIDTKDINSFRKKWTASGRLEKLLKRIDGKLDLGRFSTARRCTDVLQKYHNASGLRSIPLFREVLQDTQALLKKGIGKNMAGGACFHIGRLLMNSGKTTEAVRFLKRCLKYAPGHKEASRLLKTLQRA
jgi:glycosyltransferase involved in cell wall biosynthesis